MRTTYKYLLGLALPLLCWACTDTEFANVSQTLTEGRASVTLNISTPESFSTRTRAISEANDSVLEDKFAVFAFNYVDGDALLLFTVKSGDVNENSNLSDASSAYGDYTDSPSIAWHEDESGTGGRLYIEYDETAGPIHLLVLANVDLDEVAKLLTPEAGSETPTIYEGMSFSEVTAALEPALDYDVTDGTLTSIPMAGECELENGITLGSTGSISLRRSVAKFTVRVEYTMDRVLKEYDSIDNVPFSPDSIQITNLNAIYATVYAPNNSEPNISTLNEENKVEYSPMLYFDETSEWIEGKNSDGEDVYYKELVFFVAETENSCQPAYTANGDGTFTQNTTNPRISVLVGGTYHDNDETVLDRNWYRLDLIPESTESAVVEIQYILRNYHYTFVISDVTKRGSSTEEEALEMSIPDNEPHDENEGYYVYIEDEDIVSITMETNTTSGGEPYYVGVSSTEIELDIAQGTSACARVKVVTNFTDWSIDQYSIPYVIDETTSEPLIDSDGNYVYAISFVWNEKSETLWLWLDYPDSVTVGETYAYYIVAGNIRKKMRITIVDSSATGDGPGDTGGDESDEERP